IRYRRAWFFPGALLAAVGVCASLAFSALGRPRIALICVAVAYAVLIVAVGVGAFLAKQARVNRLLSRAGMALFILCDINVAIFNILPLQNSLHGVSAVLMWAFYLPAQTLLALSAYGFRSKPPAAPM
ncbi:MAG: lysoplasmalogenase family protein, partial [Clostridiales Family XIII bacterium]|nr:lysoplasmalogenase family protein [Clostridiales Family XIII bacterium]